MEIHYFEEKYLVLVNMFLGLRCSSVEECLPSMSIQSLALQK
jgi:hypothetical protein